jgi:hypothetical protein
MDNWNGMIALNSDAIFEGEESSGVIDVEMLRVGNFEHSTHGTLEITDDLLNSMVNNFNKDVLGREVSFDWNHEAKKASGWLREVRVDNGYLIGTMELTKSGKESIEGKEYGYFSIEYSSDYEDAETGDTYGPTIMGGALTNRPFISKLKKIEFSLDNEDIKLYREVKEMPEDIKREPAKTKEAEGKKDVKLEELEEIQAKNVELEEKLKKLEESNEEADEGNDVKLEEFIDAQKKLMDSMETKITKLEETNKSLEEDNLKTKEAAKVSEIKLFCDKLLNDSKHHPAVVETVKDILLENPSEKKIYKLSETVGEGDDAKTREVDVSLMGVISNILASFPDSQKADYTEETTSDSVSLSEKDQEDLENKAMDKAFAKKNIKRKLAVV